MRAKKKKRTFVCKRESIIESVRDSVHEQLLGSNQGNKQNRAAGYFQRGQIKTPKHMNFKNIFWFAELIFY